MGSVTEADVAALASRDPAVPEPREVSFIPARILLQDFTGVPVVVDLAAMRDAVEDLGDVIGRPKPRGQPGFRATAHHTRRRMFGCEP